MTEVLQNRDFTRFDDYVADDLIQHAVGLADGRAACRERIEEAMAPAYAVNSCSSWSVRATSS